MSGVRKVLLRLIEQGLVLNVPGGYLLQREHLAAPAVLLLAGMRSELLRRIGEFSDQQSMASMLLGVFGSFARRDGDASSDIDLLLVGDAAESVEHAGDLAERVRTWTGNACGVVALSSADVSRMHRKKDRILHEWANDVVVIRGDISALRGRR